MFKHRWSAGNYVGALTEAYWNFGMAITQIVFAPIIALGLSRRAEHVAA